MAAVAVAVIALGACIALWISLRRLRGAQKVLLPDGASVGLVDRQASLQRAQARLEQGLADLQSLVERQGEVTERSLRSALRFQGMVRYDAYRDMGGSQSWSIALHRRQPDRRRSSPRSTPATTPACTSRSWWRACPASACRPRRPAPWASRPAPRPARRARTPRRREGDAAPPAPEPPAGRPPGPEEPTA